MTTLASLALLKTRHDIEGTDFLDTLRPFVAYAIVKDALSSFSAMDIQSRMLEQFGLAIPRHSVDLVLRRMTKADQLRLADKVFTVIDVKFDVVEFERHRADATQHQNATEAGLILYAKEVLNLTLTKDDAEAALNSYIDQYSIDCINAYSHGSIVPVHGKSNKHWPYIVSSYVNVLSEREPEKFRYLVTVVMGRMLSNALLGEDLGAIDMKFHNTCVYLDTPIVLQLLGSLGDAPQLLAEEMLVLLMKSRAEVAVFDHIADEVDQVLASAQRHLENGVGGKSDVISALRQLGYTASDVAVLRSSVASQLTDRRIVIKQAPSYVLALQVDDKAVELEMEKASLFYRVEAAKRVDINSIRSIYVLRKGKVPRRVEDCGAILVTTNTGLARAAYAYGKHHEESRELSSVITDFSLTNLLWLKAPMDYVDVPRRMIAVNCFAALHPSDEFWSAFLSQLEKMHKTGRVTALQHQFLRYELRVRRDLMNLTLGDETSLTDEQILQVIGRYEQELTKPLYEKVGALEESVKKAQTERDGMSAIVGSLEKKIESFALYVRRAIAGLLVVIAVVLIAIAHDWIGGERLAGLGRPWRLVLQGGVYLIDVFIVLHLFVHVTIWNPIRKLAEWVERNLIRMIRRVLGLGPVKSQ